jgi:hypothetical protein
MEHILVTRREPSCEKVLDFHRTKACRPRRAENENAACQLITIGHRRNYDAALPKSWLVSFRTMAVGTE